MTAPAPLIPAAKPSVARARKLAAGEGAELGELSISSLRLPPDLRTALRATIAARDVMLQARPDAEIRRAADLAEAVAVDIAVLANHLAGRPRNIDLLRLLTTIDAAILALVEAYGTSAAGKRGAPK